MKVADGRSGRPPTPAAGVGALLDRRRWGVALRWPPLVLASACLAVVVVRQAAQGSIDFEHYYGAARAVWAGERLYERGLQWRDSGYTVYLPGTRPDEPQAYVYPPLLAMGLVWLLALPYDVGRLVWLVVSLLCIAAAVCIVTGLMLPLRRLDLVVVTVVLCAALVFMRPTRVVLATGQADGMLLLLLASTVAAFVAARPNLAGISLALAVAVKPFLAFLLLYLVWKRAWRSAVVAGGLGALLIALPLAALGAQAMVDYLSVTAYLSSQTYAVGYLNQGPYGFLLRRFTENPITTPIVDAPSLVPAIRGLLMVGVLTVLARTVSRSGGLAAQTVVLEFGLAIVAMLLISPLAQPSHYVYLLVPYAASIALVLDGGLARGPRLAVATGIVALYLYFVYINDSMRLSEMHLLGLCGVAALTYAATWVRRATVESIRDAPGA